MLNRSSRRLLRHIYISNNQGIFNINRIQEKSSKEEIRPYRYDSFQQLINRYIIYKCACYDFLPKYIEKYYKFS